MDNKKGPKDVLLCCCGCRRRPSVVCTLSSRVPRRKNTFPVVSYRSTMPCFQYAIHIIFEINSQWWYGKKDKRDVSRDNTSKKKLKKKRRVKRFISQICQIRLALNCLLFPWWAAEDRAAPKINCAGLMVTVTKPKLIFCASQNEWLPVTSHEYQVPYSSKGRNCFFFVS